MNTCPQFRDALALLAVRSLDAPKQNELQEHLQSCPGCRAHFAQLQSLASEIETATSARHSSELPTLPAGFHQRLQSRLAADARTQAAPATISESTEQTLSWTGRLILWLTPLRLTTVAAAVVVIVLLLQVRPTPTRTPQNVQVNPAPTPASPGNLNPPQADPRLSPLHELSLFAMSRAWNDSEDGLNQLLTREAKLLTSAGPASRPLNPHIEF